MEIISIWLIYHKASIDELSPMNEDGSEYMIGTGIVPATGKEEAITLFDRYLEDQRMKILDVKKIENYDPDNFDESKKEDKQIIHAVTSSLEDERIRYIGISSEAMDCEEGEGDD